MEQQFSFKAFIATFVLLSLAMFAFTYSKQSNLAENKKSKLHSVKVSVDSSKTESIEENEEIIDDLSDVNDSVKQDTTEEEVVTVQDSITTEDTPPIDHTNVAKEARALISIVIYDYGLSTKASENIFKTEINGLTLSLSPYSKTAQYWIETANRFQSEAWLSTYISTKSNPNNKDYGHLSIVEGLSNELNNKRINTSLENSTGIEGVINFYKGTSNIKELTNLYKILSEQNIPMAMFSDIKNFENDVKTSPLMLPYNKNSTEITDFLNSVKAEALEKGTALAAIPPHPLVLKHLKQWNEELKASSIKIVPLSILKEHS